MDGERVDFVYENLHFDELVTINLPEAFNHIETTMIGYDAEGGQLEWSETDWAQRGRCSNPPVGEIIFDPYECTLTYKVEGTDFELVAYRYKEVENLLFHRPV